MNRNSRQTVPQLVIVLKNVTLSNEVHSVLTTAEQSGEPLPVRLLVAGREVEASMQVLNGPTPVFGGPRDTTTMALCAVDDSRKPVQEV